MKSTPIVERRRERMAARAQARAWNSLLWGMAMAALERGGYEISSEERGAVLAELIARSNGLLLLTTELVDGDRVFRLRTRWPLPGKGPPVSDLPLPVGLAIRTALRALPGREST